MSEWPTDTGPIELPGGDVSAKPSPPGDAATASTDDGTGAGNGAGADDGGYRPPESTDGGTPPSSVETVEVPDFMRAAMEAAGVNPNAVALAAADPNVLPTDEESAFIEAVRRENGMRCATCKQPVKPDDPNVLREIVGWSKPREAGGQNHVIDRRETGALLCGNCALRLHHGVSPQQEQLAV